MEVLERAISLHPDQRGVGVSSWKERDKLTSAFLLSTPSPKYGLSSPIMAEAPATMLCLPSRVCADRLGEKVGASKVDKFGVRFFLENLPGGQWTDRHNAMEQEVTALCAYTGLPAEREPFGLFGHLLPQQALTQLHHQQIQVLRPDLRMDIPSIKVRTQPAKARRAPGQAVPAPVSLDYSGSHIAEIKVLGKGVKNFYELGTTGEKAVDRRAVGIPADYKMKASKMDQAMGVEEGPCQRRLAELPLIMLCWGAYGEGSSGVHTLVTLLATCRVRTEVRRCGWR